MFVLLFGLSLSISVKANNENVLNIHVYYESLCPDSRKFIIYEVKEAYENFQDIANIILIPFGKANVSIRL
jgi:interferon gamma-inducible protein 30